MEEKLSRYVRRHMMTVLIAVLSSFLLLFLGEFLLYKKIMVVNRMVSEGLMQIKEINKVKPTLIPTLKILKK
ncbi:hypothetical protein D4R99_02780 [bacterium]|nr:MAG: hypothetical protein D4R99_02780 [bacterium]